MLSWQQRRSRKEYPRTDGRSRRSAAVSGMDQVERAALIDTIRRSRGWWIGLALVAWVSSGCQGAREGITIAGLSVDGQLVAGIAACDQETFELPDEANIWLVTGDREDPLELLWRGSLSTTSATAPAQGVDVFASYQYEAGSVQGLNDILSGYDGKSVIVTLVNFGGSILPVSEMEANRGSYMRNGWQKFEEIQLDACGAAE